MQLHVGLPDGSSLAIEIDCSATFATVIETVQRQGTTTPDYPEVVFNGAGQRKDTLLAEAGVSAESLVYIRGQTGVLRIYRREGSTFLFNQSISVPIYKDVTARVEAVCGGELGRWHHVSVNPGHWNIEGDEVQPAHGYEGASGRGGYPYRPFKLVRADDTQSDKFQTAEGFVTGIYATMGGGKWLSLLISRDLLFALGTDPQGP